MYTLDTNVVLYYLQGEEVLVDRIKLLANSGPLFVSTITETELLRFPPLTLVEERGIHDFLLGCSVIPFDSTLAHLAAGVSRTTNIKLADSVIAATALFTGSTLLTRNIRDFKRVPGLLVERT